MSATEKPSLNLVLHIINPSASDSIAECERSMSVRFARIDEVSDLQTLVKTRRRMRGSAYPVGLAFFSKSSARPRYAKRMLCCRPRASNRISKHITIRRATVVHKDALEA